MIDDQYCELWFEDDLVLDWNYELGIVRLRNYEIRNNTIHFSHQYFDEETPEEIAFSMKIKRLGNGSMTLQDVVHPEHPKFIYHSIDEKAPDFSLDILNTEKQSELERKLRRASEKRIIDFN